MNRPTILDRDDVAVVPVEPTPEMIAAAWNSWKVRHKEKLGPGPGFVEAITAAIAASPHSSAWQEAREYVAGLEKENADLRERFDWDRRTYAAEGKAMQAEHRAEAAEARIKALERENAILRAEMGDPDRRSRDALEKERERLQASRDGYARGRDEIQRLYDEQRARIAALELRLAEAERVIEPFANSDVLMFLDNGSMGEADTICGISGFTYGDLRAARAWKEGK